MHSLMPSIDRSRSVTSTLRIGGFGIIPSLSMNRVINPLFSVNAATTIDGRSGGISDANIGFITLFPQQKARIDVDVQISDAGINAEAIISRDITKKFLFLFVRMNILSRLTLRTVFLLRESWRRARCNQGFGDSRSTRVLDGRRSSAQTLSVRSVRTSAWAIMRSF